jgi:riboflavin biosynthesis pyrimidine reductase
MPASVLSMSMSLDGFIAGPNEGPDIANDACRRFPPSPRPLEAAGEKNVLVHGAAVAQLALAAGVLDELELHVVPVLFGLGRRLFEGLPAEQIELERTRTLEGDGGVTHMHYRVRKESE